MNRSRPFKISVLVHLRDEEGRLLLLKRKKYPNHGLWSCIGGKLEMEMGESPFECAIRETREETGLEVAEKDLHLFAMISEKNYEDNTHWLMFLFDCSKTLDRLPSNFEEGDFAFHQPEQIENLPIPETDRAALWPVYFKHRKGFVVMRAECAPGNKPEVIIEERQ